MIDLHSDTIYSLSGAEMMEVLLRRMTSASERKPS